MMITNRYRSIRPPRYSAGITILEALIAAFILAGGLLGMATLHIKSLQAASDAYYRSKATDLAADLSDRMRANLLAITASSKPYEGETNCATISNADLNKCISGECTSAQMASFDLAQVRCVHGVNTLPGGNLTVTCQDDSPFASTADPCDDASNYLVEVSWKSSASSTLADIGGISEKMRMSIIPGVPR